MTGAVVGTVGKAYKPVQTKEAAGFHGSNPVVRKTALRAYRGWVVREYADGMFDACDSHGLGLTWGCDSFAEATLAVRELIGR